MTPPIFISRSNSPVSEEKNNINNNRFEAPRERKLRKMKEKFELHYAKISELRNEYDPRADPNAGSTDPLKTVFVARISYDTSEKKLKREFEQYGPVKKYS